MAGPRTIMELRKWRRKGVSGVIGFAYNDERGVYFDGEEFILLAGTWAEDATNWYVTGPLHSIYKLPKEEEQK